MCWQVGKNRPKKYLDQIPTRGYLYLHRYKRNYPRKILPLGIIICDKDSGTGKCSANDNNHPLMPTAEIQY